MRRRDQLLTLKKWARAIMKSGHKDPAELTFAEIRTVLSELGLLDRTLDEDRQVAQLVSYSRGHTTDEDARWSLFG